MRARNLILVLLVVVLGAGTMFLINQWLSSQEAALRARDQQQTETTQRQVADTFVLVAARPLPAGRFLRPGDVRWQAWPSDEEIPENYIRQGTVDPQQLLGAVMRRGVTVGQPVAADIVIRPGEQGFLAAALWPGMRAVSVPVNANTGVSGLVFPGDRVDILLIRAVRIQGRGASYVRRSGETVLENVRVIAIDQTTGDLGPAQESRRQVPDTVTLELTPRQAEMIVLAQQMGLLALSLRSLSPEEDSETARSVLEAVERGESVVMVGNNTGEAGAATTSSANNGASQTTGTTTNGFPIPRHIQPERGRTITRDSQVSRMTTDSAERQRRKVITVVRGSSAERLEMREGRLRRARDEDDEDRAERATDNEGTEDAN